MADSPSAAAFEDARSDLTPDERSNSVPQNPGVPDRPGTRRTLFHTTRETQQVGEEHDKESNDDNGDVVVVDNGTPKYLSKSPEDGGYDSSEVEEEYNDVGDGDSVADSPDCELLDSATTETLCSRLEVVIKL